MRRLLEAELRAWAQNPKPKPLLLRGARQVGKSYLAEQICSNFQNRFVINFERNEQQKFKQLFTEKSPAEILEYIKFLYNIDLRASNSILFIDEIQSCPEAITSLRYFYEDFPCLHLIAAGSLLDISLSQNSISVPVGRIDYLYIHPLNFLEYLEANQKPHYIEYIRQLSLTKVAKLDLHDELMQEIKKYILVGGMPAVLNKFIESSETYQEAFVEQNSILETFRDDFRKYASRSEQKYLRLVFDSIPMQFANKFMFSRVDPEQKSLALKKALFLLEEANIAKLIYQSNPNSQPLAVGVNHKFFKVNFLDCGLANRIFNMAIPELSELKFEGLHAGKITEQFCCQELISYTNPRIRQDIYYWAREDKSQAAEIDYLVDINNTVVPIEVKSSHNGRLKSLKIIMDTYKLQLGLKISAERLSLDNKILSLPLYAISELPRLSQEALKA